MQYKATESKYDKEIYTLKQQIMLICFKNNIYKQTHIVQHKNFLTVLLSIFSTSIMIKFPICCILFSDTTM